LKFRRRDINRLLEGRPIHKRKRRSAWYEFLGAKKEKLYDGSSGDIWRRLYDALFKRSDYHPKGKGRVKGKTRILNKTRYVRIIFMPLSKARAKDRRVRRRFSRK